MRRLPPRRLDSCKRLKVRVGPSSTIRVNHNVYSVHSRLIREIIEVRLSMDHLGIWYAQQRIETIPRLRGEGKHHIQYRHIIDWLVRKPGAFENYRYRKDMFPSIGFRMAYDGLKRQHTRQKAAKEYLKILNLAAKEGERLVEEALECLSELGGFIVADHVCDIVLNWKNAPKRSLQVHIKPVDLQAYDQLLAEKEAIR